MRDLHWVDFLRLATMALAITSMYFLAVRARHRWATYTDRLKDLWWVLNAFLFLLAEGSIEQIISDAPYGPRTFLSFLVTLICLRAVMRNEGLVKDD